MALRNTERIRRQQVMERVPLSPYRAMLSACIMAAFAGWSIYVLHNGMPLKYAALPFLSGLLLSLPLAIAGIRQLAEEGFSFPLLLAIVLDLAAFMTFAGAGYVVYTQTGGIPSLD